MGTASIVCWLLLYTVVGANDIIQYTPTDHTCNTREVMLCLLWQCVCYDNTIVYCMHCCWHMPHSMLVAFVTFNIYFLHELMEANSVKVSPYLRGLTGEAKVIVDTQHSVHYLFFNEIQIWIFYFRTKMDINEIQRLIFSFQVPTYYLHQVN